MGRHLQSYLATVKDVFGPLPCAPTSIDVVTADLASQLSLLDHDRDPFLPAAIGTNDDDLDVFARLDPRPPARTAVHSTLPSPPATLVPSSTFLDRQLAEYMLFPLFHVLKSKSLPNLSQAAVEAFLELLEYIWLRVPSDAVEFTPGGGTMDPMHVDTLHNYLLAVSLYVSAAAPRASLDTPPVTTTEEIKSKAVRLLLAVFRNGRDGPACMSRRFRTGTTKGAPAPLISLRDFLASQHGRMVTTYIHSHLVEIVERDALPSLRLAALDAMRVLLLETDTDPDMLAPVLPKTASVLVGLTQASKVGAPILGSALRLLSDLITAALARNIANMPSNDLSNQWAALVQRAAQADQPGGGSKATAEPSSTASTTPTLRVTRDDTWRQETAIRLHSLLTVALDAVARHDHPDVHIAGLDMAGTLLTKCSNDLAAARTALFMFTARQIISPFPTVRDAAQRVMAMLARRIVNGIDSFEYMTQALDRAVADLQDVVLKSDDVKPVYLRAISGCLLSWTVNAELQAYVEQPIRAALQCQLDPLLRELVRLLRIDDADPLRSEVGAPFDRWNCVGFHAKDVYDAVRQLVHAVVRVGGNELTTAVLRVLGGTRFLTGGDGVDRGKTDKFAVLILLNLALEVECFEPVVFEYLERLHDATNPLELAFIIEGLSVVRLPNYTAFLAHHLHAVLAFYSSSHRALQSCATACLDHLVRVLECRSLDDLLARSGDYLVHSIQVQLQYADLHPGTAHLFRSVIRVSGARAIPWLRTGVVLVLDALGRHMGNNVLWREFVQVLLEFVKVVPTPDLANASKGSTAGQVEGVSERWRNVSPWLLQQYRYQLAPPPKSPLDEHEPTGEPLDTDGPGDMEMDTDAEPKLPLEIDVLLTILQHARNLLGAATLRVRHELLVLIAHAFPKLAGYDRQTNPEIYRILNVVSLASIPPSAPYLRESTLRAFTAMATQSPDYGASNVKERYLTDIVALIDQFASKVALETVAAVVADVPAAFHHCSARDAEVLVPALLHGASKWAGEPALEAHVVAIVGRLLAHPRTRDATWFALVAGLGPDAGWSDPSAVAVAQRIPVGPLRTRRAAGKEWVKSRLGTALCALAERLPMSH
ncbi:TEL2-interacting protein 1 [Allomyces javanicus]|nr:TEL2-interacting protein 1 [Allomyces javanicus]